MTNNENNSNDKVSFEGAFSRLEQILETMNGEKVSLDESLKLFEEADKLIATCSNRLNSAEKKVLTLIKNRNELLLDENQKPQTSEFNTQNSY
jgi:exodeoxyribonuclease VII small subunit